MSEEMAAKKRNEIEQIESTEKQLLEEMSRDCCPRCGLLTNDFAYFVILPPPFGWVECPKCGTIFSPLSIRKVKLEEGRDGAIKKIIRT